MKFTLDFYRAHLKEIARTCGMSEMDLESIDRITAWEEMLAFIDFLKACYGVPAYKIGPEAVRTHEELAESLHRPDSWYHLQAATMQLFGPYNEWEMS